LEQVACRVRLTIGASSLVEPNPAPLSAFFSAEGLVGLSKSLDRFDASKGFKFSTYAHWWIRQAISRAVCGAPRLLAADAVCSVEPCSVGCNTAT
jgi:hypothetical protein